MVFCSGHAPRAVITARGRERIKRLPATACPLQGCLKTEREAIMKRREFLAASTAATLGVVASNFSRAAEEGSERMLIEVRIYQFASPQKQQAYEQFLGTAGIAALNRAGVTPVG